jgi:YggT family protein
MTLVGLEMQLCPCFRLTQDSELRTKNSKTAMFMLGNFVLAIAKVIDFALSAYIWIVIARAVISWVNADPYNPIVRFLVQVTDPVLLRIRRYIPAMGGIDLTPMILIFAIVFLQSFLVPTLMRIGLSMQ